MGTDPLGHTGAGQASTKQTGELLQLIVATREYQFA
jgi:hypothetical protein